MFLPSLHPPGKISDGTITYCNHRRDGRGAVQRPQIIIRGLIGLRRRHSTLHRCPGAQRHPAHCKALPVLQLIVRQPPGLLIKDHGHLHGSLCPALPNSIEELSLLVIGMMLQCILLPLQRIPSLSHLLCLARLIWLYYSGSQMLCN